MSRADFRICPNCETRNKSKWEFCVKCGESLQNVPLGDRPAAGAVAKGTAARSVEAEGSGIPWRSLFLSALAIGAAVVVYVVFKDPPTPTDPAAFTFPTAPAPPPTVAADKTVPGDAGLESFEQGRRLLARGDVAGAMPLLEAATLAAPSNPLYQSTFGQALWRFGQQDRAIDAFRRAVTLEPLQAVHRLDLARALMATGQMGDATSALEELLRTQPTHTEALEELSRAYTKAGQHDKALPYLEKLAGARPGDAVVQQEYGQALERKGDLANAARVYEGIVERQPDAAITRGLLSEVLLKAGNNEGAIKVMQDGLERDPESALLHRGVAIVYERTGRIADAVAEYRAYARLAPRATDAQELKNRADMLEKQQSPPPASPTSPS
jgi:predicted Zn-dependent protease